MERQIVYSSPHESVARTLNILLEIVQPENTIVVHAKDLNEAKEKIEAGETGFVLLHVTSQESVLAAQAFLKEVKGSDSPYKSIPIAILSSEDSYEQEEFKSLGADMTIGYNGAFDAIEAAVNETLGKKN